MLTIMSNNLWALVTLFSCAAQESLMLDPGDMKLSVAEFISQKQDLIFRELGVRGAKHLCSGSLVVGDATPMETAATMPDLEFTTQPPAVGTSQARVCTGTQIVLDY